ncbi:MAG: gliding motility protein GldM [Cytophagales bacterium]|nr:gliding motility protein GldM [Cytophaga sp.]
MSSGRETPRQRMIGMMYLVLTALLALQVSSAIIEKFYALNKSIETSVNNSAGYNAEKLLLIKTSVKERGNRSDEIKLAEQAQQLHARSQEILSFMETLKTEMISKTGGFDEDGNLKGAKEETEVEVYMLGSSEGKGKAYELQKKLQEYVSFVQTSTGQKFPSLALDAKDDPLFQNNADQKNKDFAQLNFAQTPLVAAMAVISDLQSKVANMESNVMNEYQAKVGITDMKVNRMIPMVRAKSKYIPAGTKYEAEVFMAATSTSLLPDIMVGTQKLNVNDDGIGAYNFTATGGNYSEDGLTKKTWTANVKMKGVNGKDTVFTVSEEYFVVKPVIKVQSASMKALYFNCGNKMDIQVPALAAEYNPEFRPTGATVKSTSVKGRVFVIPTSPTVKIGVYNKGQFIGDETFPVRAVPKPTIEVRVNGRAINQKEGIKPNELRTISIKAIPDKEFADNQPEDVTYKVVEWEIDFGRGRRSINGLPAQKPVQEQFSLGAVAASLQDKDMIFVTPKKVMRKTYLGTWEEVKVSVLPILIPINN